MSSFIKKLAGETAIYGISTIVGRTLNYLLVPLYTAIFQPREYGIITELYAYVAFLTILYTYGLETGYFRFASNGPDEEKKIYQTTITALLISSILLSGILILAATPLTILLQYPGKEKYIVWLALILSTDALTAIPFAKLRWEKKAKRFTSIKLINIILTILITVFLLILCPYLAKNSSSPRVIHLLSFIYNPKRHIEYVFIANLIANLFTLGLFYRYFIKVKLKLSFAYFKKVLSYSMPILLIGLAGMTNEMLSRIMLKWRLPENFYPGKTNLDAVGIFGACYKLSIFMSLAIQAFKFAAEPFFFSQSKDKNSPQLFADVMQGFILVCCILFLAVSVNLHLLGTIFLRNKTYHDALHVVPILLLANLFLGIYYNLSTWFKLTDRTYFGTYFSLIGAGLTILLNYIFIPIGGYEVSAYITLLCYISMAAICYYYGQKYYPIPYQTKSALLFITTTCLFVYLTNLIPHTSFATSIILPNLLILVYSIFSYRIFKHYLKKHTTDSSHES